MDIQPLNGILNGIGSGGEWDEQRQLQRLMSQWEAIVGATVAQHSCPLEVHNGILQVATSTAVWAQNLSFERRRILTKLNQRAHFKILGLREIRFSTAQWHNRPGSNGAITLDKRLNSYQQQMQWQQHPSRLPPPEDERPHSELAESASQAFDRWSQRRQQQINQVPPCPQCQTPTPEGELQRWGVCAFCMTQQWEAEKKVNQPDGSQEADDWKKGPPSSMTVEEARQAEQSKLAQPARGDESQDSEADLGKIHGAMFKQFQDKLAAESPQPPHFPQLSKREPSSFPSQQLQPRAGLPPVAFPSPPTSTTPSQASPTTPSIDSLTPGQGSPDSSVTQREAHQDKTNAFSTSPPGLSQNPALTGPLAPLRIDEQQSWQAAASLPEAQHSVPPETQKQAAWAQAFQGWTHQEAQRQQQQGELEQRQAARIRQVRGDREATALTNISPSDISQPLTGASLDSNAITSKDGAKEDIHPPINLASGRSKPVLKKQRRILPKG